MVCVPCIVIPILLWVFHRFLQPYIMPLMPAKIKSWFSGKAEKLENYGGPPPQESSSEKHSEKKTSCESETTTSNGSSTEIKTGAEKKTD